ncbi:transposase [Methylococcus capsulatus]|nr:transposase [Methylococcus capsulatus]
MRRRARTRFLTIDAQSFKNTDGAGRKGCDAGKEVSAIERHPAVDAQGLPHAIAMTTAEVTDRQGALQAMDRCAANPIQVGNVSVDRGHTGRPFAEAVGGAPAGHASAGPLRPTASPATGKSSFRRRCAPDRGTSGRRTDDNATRPPATE